MFLTAFAAMVLVQAPAPEESTPTPDEAQSLSAPPKLNPARAILCSCAKTKPPQFMLQGLVVDAELTLAPDGRNAQERQATIFNVLSATENGEPADIGKHMKIFHRTQAAQCGVNFDYGKEYMVYARKTEEGAYETDYCLMNAAFDVLPPEANGEQDATQNEEQEDAEKTASKSG